MLLPNSCLQYLKLSLLIFSTKLFNEELRNWKLSIKINLLLTVKFTYCSNPFRMMFISILNFPTFCMTIWEKYFFRLWNTTEISWFNLILMLQSLWAEPLYFPVIWQWSITSLSTESLSQIQHLLIFVTSLVFSSSLLKRFLSRQCNIDCLWSYYYKNCKLNLCLCMS